VKHLTLICHISHLDLIATDYEIRATAMQ